MPELWQIPLLNNIKRIKKSKKEVVKSAGAFFTTFCFGDKRLLTV